MINVQKADGHLEPFNAEKIRASLLRAGTEESVIAQLLTNLQKDLPDGITTAEIQEKINRLLPVNASVFNRYNLKRAIMALGPSGFPFEKFFAGVLGRYQYQTSVNQIIKGKCVDQEIDIVALKEGRRLMIECKFHQRPGTKSGLRTALYTHARFLDVAASGNFQEHWLVTNTKVTTEALAYAQCSDLKIVSWDYPEGFSLRELVEKANLHPITALRNLSPEKQRELLLQGKIFATDLK